MLSSIILSYLNKSSTGVDDYASNVAERSFDDVGYTFSVVEHNA